jgi:hypothetical protein
LAFGINNIASFSQTDLFLVLSKKLRTDLTLHFGFATDVLNTTISPQLMFGGEMLIAKNLQALAEIVGSGSDWSASAGVRFFLSPNLIVNAAMSDITDSSASQPNIFTVGLAYIDFM